QQCSDSVQLPTVNEKAGEHPWSSSARLLMIDAERQVIMSGDARLACRSERGWSPVSPQIGAVHHHLWLVLSLRNRKSGIHVETLRPRVIAAELQTVAQPLNHFQLQRIIAAVSGRVPEEPGIQKRIRPRGSRGRG